MAAGDLLAAMLGTQVQAATSPYGVASQAIGQSTPLLINPYDSPGKNIAASVGTGLVAALLAGLARNDAQTENARLAPLRREYIGATPERRQAILQDAPQLANLDAVLAMNDLERADKVQTEKQLADVLRPGKIDEAERTSAAQARGKVLGETLAYAITPGADLNPDSPAAKAKAKRFEQSTTLRKEVEASQPYGDYATVVPVYQSMIASLDKTTRAADLDYIYGIAKIMDPKSVVRDSETNLVKSANPVVQKTIDELYSQLTGEGSLSRDTRLGLIEAAQSRLGAYKAGYDQYLLGKEGTAKRYGLDPADIKPEIVEPDLSFKTPTRAAIEARKSEILAQNPNIAPVDLAAALRSEFGG